MQGTHAIVLCSLNAHNLAETHGWKNRVHRFIKSGHVHVLFMDTNAQYCSHTNNPWRRAESQTQNTALRPVAIFILQEFLLLTTVADVFNVLHQCSVLFRINELHLPTNQKPIKTYETPTLQTRYTEQTHPIPSILPSLELTFSPLVTLLSPLWVSAFTGKLCLTSHIFWYVGVWLYYFPRGFNLWFFVFNVCVWFLCSTFVCSFCVFHDTSMWVSLSFV